LVKAQKEFGPALKTATNPHFRSKYANLSNCVEAVIDALNNNGIFLLQKNYDHQNGIMVETVFVHESGEMLECGCLFFPAQKNDPQGFMSALTYGRRASLMAACGIAPEDDDGEAAVRPKKTTVDSSAMADHLIAIQDAKDSDELKAAYTAAYKACGTDANWQKKIIAAKDEKKASLA
jgi:hypothetical protein